MLIHILMQKAAGAAVARSAQAMDARPHSSYRTVVCRRAEATERDILTGTRLAVDRLVGESNERRDGGSQPWILTKYSSARMSDSMC